MSFLAEALAAPLNALIDVHIKMKSRTKVDRSGCSVFRSEDNDDFVKRGQPHF